MYCAPCYTIALTHGSISGAGSDLAAACNRRIATADTRYRFPGIRFGTVLGTRRLLELVGKRGYSIVLEQEQLSAQEALQIGLISDIIERDHWEARVGEVANRIAQVPDAARKQLLHVRKDLSLCEQDLGILARSLIQPGLKSRVQAYWDSARSAARKAAQSNTESD